MTEPRSPRAPSAAMIRTLRRDLALATARVKQFETAQQANEALRESEERYRRLFEDDLTGDYLATPDGRILDCNPAFIAILGFQSRTEALRTNLRTLHAEEEDYATFIADLRARGKLEQYECVRQRRDGVRIHVVENAVVVTDARGEVQQIRGYLFDNTAAKRAEQALRETEARYRGLIEFLPDAVVVSDAAERIVFANPAAARLIGAAGPEALVGRSLFDLFHPRSHATVHARSQAALTEGVPGPAERRNVVRLDESVLHVETAVTPIQFDGQPGVLRVPRCQCPGSSRGGVAPERPGDLPATRQDREIERGANRAPGASGAGGPAASGGPAHDPRAARPGARRDAERDLFGGRSKGPRRGR